MDNLEKILLFLNRIEKLKTIKRAISVSDVSKKESPAEHMWRVAVMAMVLHRELALKIDLLKALEICLVHDIVQVGAGDVWIRDKNDAQAHQNKKAKEMKAAEEVYALLPSELGVDLKSLWMEYEERSSREALFARALNKLEVVIQRLDLGAENWEDDDVHTVLYNWADEAIAEFPELKAFWELLQKHVQQQYIGQ